MQGGLTIWYIWDLRGLGFFSFFLEEGAFVNETFYFVGHGTMIHYSISIY